ncbi:MAG: MFS transporter [Pseudomonadales bacterium]|nr:MFS transporter [Pseudomonadales bacterium]
MTHAQQAPPISSSDKSPSPANPAQRWAQPLIFLSIISVGMGQTLVFAILPSLGREVGLMEVQIGGIISASSVIFSLSSAIWGNQSERWGRKRVMIIGLSGYTLGTLLFATTFWLGLNGWLVGWMLFASLVFTRMLQSTVMAAATPAATAYMADITDFKSRTAAMGKIGAAQSIGTIAGPAVGGGLAIFSLLLPLYVAAAVTFVATILVWKLLPESPHKRNNSAAPLGIGQQIIIAIKGYFDKRYVSFLFIGVSMFMAFAVTQQTLGFFYQDRMGLDGQHTAQTVGIAMIISAISSLIAQGVIVQRFNFEPMTLVRMGLPIMAIGFFILANAEQHSWLIGCLAFVGFGMGLTMPGFTAAATLSVSASEQGAVAGVIAASPALGFIVGPIVGTTLYQYGETLPYWFTTGVFIPLTAYVWWLKPEKTNEK